MVVFLIFVGSVLGLSFFLGGKAKSAKGYYAAHGGVPWFINGIAFAGDYLSAASFLGICGMIAGYGYDGFLYSIGYLAGWVVALFVIAEPLKRLGRFTFADALDNKFNSRGIKLAAAISTLVVSLFYLIPQMSGAGALVKPLLGLEHWQGVVLVGVIVITIVTTAGMVSTTYVQFIKGSLLVIFCTILTVMILNRGLTTKPNYVPETYRDYRRDVPASELAKDESLKLIPAEGAWAQLPYVRFKNEKMDSVEIWRKGGANGDLLSETQSELTVIVKQSDNTTIVKKFVNGCHLEKGQPGAAEIQAVGAVATLPNGKSETGPLGPMEFFTTFSGSKIAQWTKEKDPVKDAGGETTIYYQKLTDGSDLLLPGNSPTFKGLKSEKLADKLNFISLMLALFCGTASLPHILIRYYTVKDQASARKSTVVGIASIGFFYILTFFLGLGAMTSGAIDPTDATNNMAAPLLSKTFGQLPFAMISAIAFTTVLGTVSGLIIAASGAVAHDLMTNFLKYDLNDHEKVRAGKLAAVVVGILAIVLGILFKNFNVTFLVGWAFNVAASANLPALIMLLFWKGTTKQGITWGIFAGLISSLVWIFLSGDAYEKLYGLKTAAPMPFNQPGLVTIPLGFAVLIVVSLLTQKKETA